MPPATENNVFILFTNGILLWGFWCQKIKNAIMICLFCNFLIVRFFTPGFQDLWDVTSSICKVDFHQQVWMFEWLLTSTDAGGGSLFSCVVCLLVWWFTPFSKLVRMKMSAFELMLLPPPRYARIDSYKSWWKDGTWAKTDRKKDIQSWCTSGQRTFLHSQTSGF